ncbi:MAG: hypothetical protein JWM33_3265, partial [Caulobacteraceae bacterium]|nr:hypothetical protein [Caulobacteraceae bacterium]
LHQSGVSLTGSAGPSIDQQSPIEAGRIEAGQIRFHMESGGGMDFTLHLAGNSLQGEAAGANPAGPITATLDVARAPGLEPLREEILEADKTLFDAYDRCDLAKFGAMFSADLEFYHDKTGLTDRPQNVEALRQRCEETTKYRRELDMASVEVYPVPGYGAVELGIHRFYERRADGPEKLDATVKFMNIWRRQGASWVLARVVSYDHD